MTIPGQGGQVPARPDQVGISAAGPPTGVVVAPGGKPVTRVTQLIVEPGGALQGIFTYSSNPPAAGTLIETASVTTAGTDAFGNHYVVGHASYAASFAASLSAGFVQFYTGSLAAGWTAGATMQTDSSGDLVLSTSTAIDLISATTLLVGSATSTIPSTNVNPGHQSAAPAAYSQSYENASTNRINEIMDVLSQTGIWPF